MLLTNNIAGFRYSVAHSHFIINVRKIINMHLLSISGFTILKDQKQWHIE